MEESSESEIEKKVGVKISELMKEVDQIITFLRALSDDVGLRFNKLLAQIDNMVAPLTNTVIKMEEAADHLTTFRESTQKALETLSQLGQRSEQALKAIESFRPPDLGEAADQVVAIRDESTRALEAVKMISEAAKQVPRGVTAGEVQLPELGEVTEQISTIREAGSKALETIRDLEEATKRMQQDLLGLQAPAAREAAPTPPTRPTVPVGGPPIPPSPPSDRKVAPPSAATPSPTPPVSKGGFTTGPRMFSSSVDQVFQSIEESINFNAGAVAKAILDVRDKVMTMTRKFGAIYELASTARELARYPERPLDKREKDAIMDKVGGWKQKLSEALGSS
nr:hypothetical protein [Candidatus Njordarchaeota archaeon]